MEHYLQIVRAGLSWEKELTSDEVELHHLMLKVRDSTKKRSMAEEEGEEPDCPMYLCRYVNADEEKKDTKPKHSPN